MQTILFVDDDPFWSQVYREELGKKFALVYKSSADGAIAELTTNEAINLLVLDVMMNTPESVDLTDTEGGLMTGVWILSKMRPMLLHRKLPIIMLTNRQKSIVIDAVVGLSYPEQQIVVFSKTEMQAKKLPSEIERRLGR